MLGCNNIYVRTAPVEGRKTLPLSYHIFFKHSVLAIFNPTMQWKHFVINYNSKYNNNTTTLFAGLNIWQLLCLTDTSSDSVSSVGLIVVQHFPFLHYKRLFVFNFCIRQCHIHLQINTLTHGDTPLNRLFRSYIWSICTLLPVCQKVIKLIEHSCGGGE